MRIHICAVGRIKTGPEAALANDYITRFNRTGRSLSLGPIEMLEVEDRKGGGMPAEADLLRKAYSGRGVKVVLDERGKLLSSPEFAAQLARWRDDGCGDTTFFIGGADGLEQSLIQDADFSLSFGKMVWPHMLVRAMLTEQLYRAASILSGGPYHRA